MSIRHLRARRDHGKEDEARRIAPGIAKLPELIGARARRSRIDAAGNTQGLIQDAQVGRQRRSAALALRCRAWVWRLSTASRWAALSEASDDGHSTTIAAERQSGYVVSRSFKVAGRTLTA